MFGDRRAILDTLGSCYAFSEPFRSFFFTAGHVSSSSCRVGPLKLKTLHVFKRSRRCDVGVHLYEAVEKPSSTATGHQEQFETRSTVPSGILYDYNIKSTSGSVLHFLPVLGLPTPQRLVKVTPPCIPCSQHFSVGMHMRYCLWLWVQLAGKIFDPFGT